MRTDNWRPVTPNEPPLYEPVILCRILREAAERLGASRPAHEPLFLNRTGGGTNEE